LVEDNPVNRLVAKGHLKKLNVSLDEVDNGQACLAQLAQKAYDLVLLDIHMPVMDGIETIQHIRKSTQSWSAVPVIALTADAMRDDRKKLLDLGMDGYASKPINRDKLIDEISQVITR
ncbi:MAG: response regulator, partial [Pseudomonadota bacterium]